jgi:hypothetical protein
MIKNIFINIKKYLTYKTKSGKLNLPIDGSKKTKSKNARIKNVHFQTTRTNRRVSRQHHRK